MSSATGFMGAWLERVSRFANRGLTRLTSARDEINAGTYDTSKLLRDVLAASDDVVEFWTAPVVTGGAVPSAFIVMKSDQSQAALATPLSVVAPQTGDPQVTVLRQLDGDKTIGANKVTASWHDGDRGKLKIDLQGVPTPVATGYYLGAVFVDQTLLATVHVNVVAP